MEEKHFHIFDPTKATAEQPPEIKEAERKKLEAELLERQKEYIELLKSRLQGKKLMVGTPMYNGVCNGEYSYSCTCLAVQCAQIGIPIEFRYMFNESLVQRARNFIVDEFYRSDSTHLLFIDADISFDPRDAITLLSLCGEVEKGKPRYDIISAPYSKKAIAWEKVLNAAKSGIADNNPMLLSNFVGDFAFNPVGSVGETIRYSLIEPLEVAEAATGFMCVGKESIELFRKKFPKQKYIPDHSRSANFDGSRPVYAVFDCGIDEKSGRYLSEDYWWSQKSREIGLHIWTCPWMSLKHHGNFIFGGSLVDHSQLGLPLNPGGIDPQHHENIKREINKNNVKK